MLSDVGDAALQEAVATFANEPIDRVRVVKAEWLGHGAKVGDGMTSVIKRLQVDFRVMSSPSETQTVRMMAKMKVPLEEKLGRWWQEMQLFEREAQFYDKVLPALQKLQKDATLPFPRVFYCRSGDNCILMEDLKEKGFQLVHDTQPERKWCLDGAEMKLILTALARFHAVSFHYVQSYPGGMTSLAKDISLIENAGRLGQFMTKNQEIWNENYQTYLKMSREMVAPLRKVLSPDLADRFERSLPDLAAKCSQSRNPDRRTDDNDPVLLVAHGDFWSNNILLKYDKAVSGGVVDIRFIDMQECMISRPTTDLECLITTSLTVESRTKDLDHFLDIYHEHLMLELKKYGYDGPKIISREKLNAEFKANFGHGFYWAIMNAWGELNKDGLLGILQTEDNSQSTAAGNQRSVWDGLKDESKLPEPLLRILSLVREAGDAGVF